MNVTCDLRLYAMIGSTAVLLVGAIVFAFAVKGAMDRTGSGGAKSLGLLFQRMQALRIATVVFCLYILLLLELTEVNTSATTGIISSIAAYVLGGTSVHQSHKEQAKDEKTQDKT